MINISIEDMLDAETSEAAIRIDDGHTSFICFSYPYTTDLNMDKAYIYALFTKNIVASCNDAKTYKLSTDYWSYHINAKVIDVENRIVNVGNLFIVLDVDIPGDIPVGTYIEFDVSRLDFFDGEYIVC